MDSVPKFDPKSVDEDLIKQLDYLKVFDNGGVRIEHPLLDHIEKCNTNFKGLNEMNNNPNLMLMWHRLTEFVEKYEPEWKYKNAYINQERINLILFQYNPWFRSRKLHEAWWYVNYANPNSYYILSWEDHADPRYWYKPGEKIRGEVKTVRIPDTNKERKSTSSTG
jgi:hypothetical protein